MKNNTHSASNFWFGFVFGGGVVVALSYAFGTKQGRDSIKRILRFSENLEENIAKTIDRIDKQSRKNPKKNAPDVLETVGTVLQKIKRVTNTY